MINIKIYFLYSRCYCSSSLAGNILSDTECSYSCSDGSVNCGGPNTLSFYEITNTTTTTTTTTSITTASTSLSSTLNPPTSISSKGGSFYNKYPNSDMFFINNNIISSSFQSNQLKCGRLCYLSFNCTSFVFKTNQNCSLYITTSSNTNLFIFDSLSSLYIKIV